MSVTRCTIIEDQVEQLTLTKMEFDFSIATTTVPQQTVPTEAIINPNDSSATIRQKMLDAIKAIALSQLGVALDTSDIIMPTLTIGAGTAISETRTDTYIMPASGETIDVSLNPMKVFSLNVVGIGGSPLAWEVVLEGSLDGINFDTILTHTHTDGIGKTVSSGGNSDPMLYFRSRCVSVSLGSASAIEATILGVP